jgi:hypothetical protein
MGPVTFGSGVLKTSTHAVILLITLYLVAPAEAAKGTLSPKAFTELYVAALREQAPDVGARITGALKLSVEWRDSGQHQIFLDNAYTQYETEPADLEKILSTYITASLESIQSADDGFDPARLVPVIKDGGYLDEIRSSLNSGDGGGEDLSLVHERYNDDLIILYAEDTPSNIRYFTEDAVEDLGLAESELRARAIENLRGLLPAIEMHGEDGTYMLTRYLGEWPNRSQRRIGGCRAGSGHAVGDGQRRPRRSGIDQVACRRGDDQFGLSLDRPTLRIPRWAIRPPRAIGGGIGPGEAGVVTWRGRA